MEINEVDNVYIYKPDLFRGRKTELKVVDQLVNSFQHGNYDNRAILFCGVRGSGKSWLAFHLSRSYYSDRSDIIPFLVRLWPLSESEKPGEGEWWLSDFNSTQEEPDLVARDAVESILNLLAKKLGLPILDQSTLEDRSYNLTRYVSDMEPQKVLLFILDSAFEGPKGKFEQLLKQLQNFLLTSLLQGKRTIVIANGRGPQPAWYSSYLRDAEVVTLGGFKAEDSDQVDKDIVTQILQECNSKFLDQLNEVCELSQGYPLVVRLIAQSKAETLEEALDTTIDQMLEIITDPTERKELRAVLNRLTAVEKPFREDEVVNLLAPGVEFEKGLQQVIAKRDRLMDHFILEWTVDNPEESGYETNQSIISPIRYFLRLYRTNEYRQYLELLIEGYKALAQQYQINVIQEYYQRLIAEYQDKVKTLE